MVSKLLVDNPSNPSILENIWFTDEAHFHLCGHINSQNYRFWGSENPHVVKEKPLHVEKCTAWCAISRQRQRAILLWGWKWWCRDCQWCQVLFTVPHIFLNCPPKKSSGSNATSVVPTRWSNTTHCQCHTQYAAKLIQGKVDLPENW